MDHSSAGPAEMILYSYTFEELGFTQRPRMIVNSENINNGSCGLSYLDSIKRYPSEPDPVSSWFCILAGEELSVAVSFIPPIYRRTFLRVQGDTLSCGIYIQENPFDPETYPVEKIMRFTARTCIGSIALLREEMKKHFSVPTEDYGYIGWNSWEYYLSAVRMSDIEENMQSILRNPQIPAVNAIIIDDGWQKARGDWDANGKFLSDTSLVAHRISSNGFIPGLWLSPVFIDGKSQFAEDPSHCVKSGGRPVDYFGFTLPDITNPAVERSIVAKIKKLENDGFRIFKLDFLYHITAIEGDPDFYDKSIPRIEMLRSFLKNLKENLLPETVMVACGCPPAACAGICAYNRIGGDVATFTNTTKILSQFLAVRYWMNGVLFRNDPDFLVARTGETSWEKELNPFLQDELGGNHGDAAGSRTGPPWKTAGEARIWASLVGMSGGSINFADRMGMLNKDGIHILRTAVSHSCHISAAPLDIADSPYPAVWFRDLQDRKQLLVINWTGNRCTVPVLRSRYGICVDTVLADFWGNGGEAMLSEEGIRFSLAGRDAVWIEYR